jgi:hypothetical protein
MSIDPDLDYYGGFTLYSHNRLIGRIYYLTLDNKSFFSAVPDGVSPEEFEELDWWVNENKDQFFMIDNLTGTRIPNDRYSLPSLYILGSFAMCPFIGYQNRPNPFKGKTIAGCIKTAVTLFSKSLIKLPYQITRAMVYCFRLTHYTSWAKEQLYQKVEACLALQKTAVIDLRRGCYTKHQEDGPAKYVSFTEATEKVPHFVPLKKEFLTHIESFILALPAQNQSEFYLQLRSWIAPEKVVELVLFDPINLDDFLMYKNIKKLALVEAGNLQSLEGLASFEQLEHIFISSVKDKTDVFDTVEISGKISADCVFAYTKERHKRWQNGCWCSCPSDVLLPQNEGANDQTGQN